MRPQTRNVEYLRVPVFLILSRTPRLGQGHASLEGQVGPLPYRGLLSRISLCLSANLLNVSFADEMGAALPIACSTQLVGLAS